LSARIQHFKWFGFHTLVRRVFFDVTIINVEPLRVGAGRGASVFEPTDLVVVKMRTADGREAPYIPGSSLKGVFRSYVVKLMRSAGLSVCGGVPGDTCLKGDEFYQYDRARASYETIIDSIANGSIKTCLACMIFGSPSLASHARFYDAYVVGDYRLGYRTMIAIDRRTGVARRGALFSVEFVEPGAKFNLRIEFVNTPNYAIGVVAEALMDMHNGLLKIGGFKTRGFGWVRIESLKVYGYDYASGGEFKDKIPGLDPIDSDVEIKSSWIETLKNFANVWRSKIPVLKRISENGWKWYSCLE